MNITMITGSFPPEACGVGYNTARLTEALRAEGVLVNVITQSKWSLNNLRSFLKQILECQPDIVHIQYPSVGYGKSILPQLISLFTRYPAVVTLHEFIDVHILRRMASILFSFRCRSLIFTIGYERDYYAKWVPWSLRRSAVIPIGSNISKANGESQRDERTVAYFGLIRTKKGLEDFIQLAKLSEKQGRNYCFEIIGMPDPRQETYFDMLRQQTIGLPIEWKVGLSPEDVAQRLRIVSFAYLPFPDGASEKRSSLLAVLGNGVVVLTKRSKRTSPDLAAVC